MFKARKLRHDEIADIEIHVRKTYEKLSKRVSKAWVKHIKIEDVIKMICACDNAWVINDSYLVCYEIYPPWYNSDITILSETLVGRFRKSSSKFSDVIEFLESKGREAGCELVAVGTALAITDRSLASLYQHEGFVPECTLLAKDISHG